MQIVSHVFNTLKRPLIGVQSLSADQNKYPINNNFYQNMNYKTIFVPKTHKTNFMERYP